MSNFIARQRKVKKIRKKIKNLNVARLSVHRTPKHIYAQVIAIDGKILASASSLENVVKEEVKSLSVTGKIHIAKLVGKLVAERCKDKLNKIAFDRGGFKYHGRVRALAESARESGLSF